MAVSDPFEILLIHNDWANRQLLEACRGLSEEQFHRKFEIGMGSLHETLTHIFGAMFVWTDLLAGRDVKQFEKKSRTIDELTVMMEQASKVFSEEIRSKGLGEMIHPTRQGKAWTFTRGGVVTHAMTHGMHHRAQALNMLRHLGVKQPLSSVAEWMRETQQLG